MRFTLRQLDYFVATGETGSIRLASERIAISQPSISAAIAHLERELGVPLFVRLHAQGLALTPAGRTLLAEAKRLIAQAEALYAVASEATGSVRGRLTVGAMVTLAPLLLPELARTFLAAYPQAELAQVQDDQEGLLDGLRRATLDVALTYDLQLPEGVRFQPLARLPVHAVVAADHPLARRAAVGLAELASEPLVLLDLPLSREYFLALFLKDGLTPVIGARSAQPDMVRALVANGFGYTLANVRPRVDAALDGRRVVRVPLAGDHRPMVVGLATLGQLRKSRLVEAFEAHCRDRITDAAVPGMAEA